MYKGLIAIPTYNEIENIRGLMEQVFEAHPEIHILVIDDHSPDGTGDLVDELRQKDKRIHLIRRPGKQGIGTAYLTAFKFAIDHKYPFVVQMDADFSHHPKYLSPMFDLLVTFDLVIGSRYIPGGGTLNWGRIRKTISWGGSLYSRIILGIPIRDFTGGFNAWRVAALEKLPLDRVRSEGYSFQIEMKYLANRYGLKTKEFPIIFEDRELGKSKMSKAIFLEAIFRVWQIRFKSFFRKRISNMT